MPAHNAESTISDTLRSALAGTYENFEIVVIDDGSTDNTSSIVKDFARTDARIQLHHRPSGGVSAALNQGLEFARGEYVARLDSDDIWHPTKLEKQVAVAAGEPDAALIYAFVRYIDGEGRVIRDAAPQYFPKHALCRCLYDGLIGGNSSAMMRRAAVEQAGGFDETLASWEDLLLFLTISAEHPIAFVPEYLVGYRVRPGSLSADPQNIHDTWRLARNKIEQRFPQIPRRVRRWAHGSRLAMLAACFAWTGRYATSAKLLLEGFAYDPALVASSLGFRLRRWLGGGLPTATEEVPPLFADCVPANPYRLSAFDRGLEGRRLRRFEETRRTELDRLDKQIAGAASRS